MAMMRSVPSALASARRARGNAGLKQRVHDEPVPLARPRQHPRCGVADIGTDLTERNTPAERVDVVLEEICVGARCARLDAVEGGVYR
jgi:hypothetical protein